MEAKLVRGPGDLPRGFRLEDLEPRPRETGVLMADPAAFRVAYAINPHMVDAAGHLNEVDPELAREQWEGLASAFEEAGLELRVLPAAAGLPDLVFTANQSLAFLDGEGERRALISAMRAPERAPEAELVREFLVALGLDPLPFPYRPGESLEGAGDLLLVPGRRLCLAGVGPRNSRSVVERLPEALGMPVVELELAGEHFYHLDTCVLPLDDHRVLAHLPALTERSVEMLEALFDLVLQPAPEEAELGLACNAVILPSGGVLIDESCVKTRALLELQGFPCRGLPSSEFLKSGGSLFCMKLFLP